MPDLSHDDAAVAVAEHPDGATVALRVVPRAPRTRVAGRYGRRVKLRVSAPPVEGAANDEVCAHLADLCGVRRADVSLLQGARSRDKTVLVRGRSVAQVVAALRSG